MGREKELKNMRTERKLDQWERGLLALFNWKSIVFFWRNGEKEEIYLPGVARSFWLFFALWMMPYIFILVGIFLGEIKPNKDKQKLLELEVIVDMKKIGEKNE